MESQPPASMISEENQDAVRPTFAPGAEKVWTSVELIRWTADYLTKKGLPEPRLTAELLLADALRCKRLDLYLQFERPLAPPDLADFKERLRRRVRREPLQYIAGTVTFRELTLQVDRRVLIPRPETELLVGEVLAWAGEREGLDVIDIGTGSGAIALSLRHEGSFGRVVATDLSEDALQVARSNALSAGMGDRIEFLHGSLLQAATGQIFDAIVSNPPYIAESERGDLAPEVVDWEPEMALFGGADGLSLIAGIVRTAPDHLRPGGLVALEIGAAQAEAVARIVSDSASFGDTRIVSDLTGRDRIVLLQKK